MIRRAYYECDNCHMKLHLLAPVERPCPACGGSFVEIDDDEEYTELDIGKFGQLSVDKVKLSDSLIDKIVEDELPLIIDGFEELLSRDAEKKGWGRNG